mgnify:CR=1 FL=1
MFIYKTTNLINGKIYIGQKFTLTNYNTYLGSGELLKKAIKKYGKENFKREIIEDNITNKETLNEREIWWINYYDSTNLEIGYNLAKGGRGTMGFHQPESVKKLFREMYLGTTIPEETKKAISLTEQGRKVDNNSIYFGIFYHNKRWIAQITHNRKHYYIGSYFTEIKAALAYNKKALELFGENAKINIISEEDQKKNEIEESFLINNYLNKKTSIYNGVFKSNSSPSWEAYINYNKERTRLGSFPTEIEAAMAYNEANLEYYGWKAKNKLNIISEEDIENIWNN